MKLQLIYTPMILLTNYYRRIPVVIIFYVNIYQICYIIQMLNHDKKPTQTFYIITKCNKSKLIDINNSILNQY